MNLNSIIKNRTVIGLLCIVLSLIICFGITPLFNSSLKEQTEVLRITRDIKKGEVLTSNSFEKVKVGKYNLPQQAIKNEENVLGKYAATDMFKGDYIFSSKITDTPYKENEYLYSLDGKRHAISISIKSFALGLSGKLKAGDIISIIATDYGDMRRTIIPPELQYLEVIAVTNSNGIDEDNRKNNTSTDSFSDNEKELPVAITILANREQTKVLAELEEKSKIHISLVFRGDKKEADKFIEAQESIFITEEKSDETKTYRGKAAKKIKVAVPQ